MFTSVPAVPDGARPSQLSRGTARRNEMASGWTDEACAVWQENDQPHGREATRSPVSFCVNLARRLWPGCDESRGKCDRVRPPFGCPAVPEQREQAGPLDHAIEGVPREEGRSEEKALSRLFSARRQKIGLGRAVPWHRRVAARVLHCTRQPPLLATTIGGGRGLRCLTGCTPRLQSRQATVAPARPRWLPSRPRASQWRARRHCRQPPPRPHACRERRPPHDRLPRGRRPACDRAPEQSPPISLHA